MRLVFAITCFLYSYLTVLSRELEEDLSSPTRGRIAGSYTLTVTSLNLTEGNKERWLLSSLIWRVAAGDMLPSAVVFRIDWGSWWSSSSVWHGQEP